ncbi:MAG: hypothetical protein HOJ88_09210, partial [Proteobacteria bacterium]|nr:hypothetical protein [Pseudomonadota bacterium]
MPVNNITLGCTGSDFSHERLARITITFSDHTELDAKLIGTDKRSDLALLKVAADDLPVVTIGTSENLKIGEWVLA